MVRGLGQSPENHDKKFPPNKRPRRKQRGIVTLFLTFHTPQGAGNLPVILLNLSLNCYISDSSCSIASLDSFSPD